MKNYYLCFFLLFSLQTISPQSVKIDSSYINYFQNTRELPHLHLNKTSFLKGEEVWFQAYVVEQNSQKLHPTSSNLYVSVFDDAGIFKEQQLIALKNGIGKGQIYLDSTFTKDHYYLKASTNWMQNFNEDNAYVQKITILSSEEKPIRKSLSENEFFEFKLFPEGGHLLANTTNNIGILIKDSNQNGVQSTEGVIKDNDGSIVEEFSTNQLGFGSIQLPFETNQEYTFEATLRNGSVIEARTPTAKNYGVTMNIITNDTDFIAINILTNTKSLQYFGGKKYRIFIHNTRAYKTYFFEFNQTDKIYTLLLEKNELPGGMNIVTVFNEKDVPVLERLIFNNSSELYADIQLDKGQRIADSLAITVSSSTDEKLFLSASFLPFETKSYNPNNSIGSTMLLRPYVKGRIESPQRYFLSTNKKRTKDLDLLLLTQGWSRYTWDHIFNKPPTTNFEFENGIDVTATVNRPLRKKEAVLIYSKENDIVAQMKPNENPFKLKNTFIKKNSSIDFALMSNGNRYEISPALTYSKAKLFDDFDITTIEPTVVNELVVSNFKRLSKEVELLDEAVVIANKRNFDNNVYGATTILSRAKMEDMIIASGETVVDFLRTKRYNVYFDNNVLKISPRGGAANDDVPELGNPLGGDEAGASLGNRDAEPSANFRRPLLRVFLDGFEVSESLWVIENLYLNTVKEIFFGRNPGRMGEEIHIYTLSPAEYLDKNAKYTQVKFPVGFATEKDYYTPKYPSLLNDTYKHYGAIYWKPDLIIDPAAASTIKIPLNLQKMLKIHVEGISTSGKLITKENVFILD